jgi:tripartite-type tricarboxylate transporter receptor subunit TctC
MKKILTILLLTLITFNCYSKETIKFVLGAAPGGWSDTIARKIQKNIQDNSSYNVVVVNKPGGEAVIALNEVLSDQSNYALFLNGSSIMVKASEQEQIMNTMMKMVPIANIATYNDILISIKKSNIKSWDNLIQESKLRPINVGVNSVGTKKLANELFGNNPNIVIVTYPGDAPALLGLLNGSVELAFLTKSSYTQNHATYEFNGIATTGKNSYMDIPTFHRLKVNAYTDDSYWGAFAKPGTPDDIVKTLSGLIQHALKDPEIIDWYNSSIISIPTDTSAASLAKSIKIDNKRYTSK